MTRRSNPWLKKNPLLSIWLSSANAMLGAARGQAEAATGNVAKVLGEAYRAVESDEDHHLYHTAGWCRELWIKSLGMPAVLPPPEEVKQVETAIGASRAEQQRDDML